MSEQLGEVPEAEVEFDFDAETLEPISEVEVDVGPDFTAFDANLAEALDEAVLDDIGTERQATLTNLKNSRDNWETRIKTGIKWLGLVDKEPGSTNSETDCQAVHPLLMENIVKFQAKAIQELWPAKGPVRTKIKGYVDAKREATASRVRAFMNYQLTEQVPGFYSDLERNLFRVGFMGTGIRKAGWSPTLAAPDPVIVFAENFYVDPAVSHLRHADEYIEVMELSGRLMHNYRQSGKFLDHGDEDCEERLEPSEIAEAIAKAQGFDSSMEKMGYRVGESHCYLDLDGADPLVPAGTLAPYIVHFSTISGKVYAIRRNWRADDPARTKRLWYTVDQFIPAFGFYGLGFAHLIGDLAASSSATLRALVDAGQFANWQAGFKSKDAKFSNSDTPLAFGEFRDVDLSPEELQKAFLPLPAKEPSQVLFQLLQFMVASGQKFADATDEVVQNGANYGPAATTLALLEASQRFYSSIHKRLHQSQHEFFRILGELNFENLPEQVRFVVNDENQFVQRTDFNPELVDILPASDPNALSESQRIAKAQIELEMAARFPQQHDMREALRRFYAAMGTDAIDKLMPNPESNAITADPMTELQAAMRGQPIKAQLGQNHAAHIAVKEAFLQTPQMQGANDPSTSVGMELLKANIAEHKVLIFIAQAMQMAQQMGVPIQDENVQAQISQQLVAMSAASGMPGEDQSTEQQMMALQARELDIAAERIKSQDARESAKLALKAQEIRLKAMSLDMQNEDNRRKAGIAAASKLLDNQAKMAQTARNELSARVENPSPSL